MSDAVDSGPDRTFFRLAVEFKDEWIGDRCSGMSAEIAFFALLGLFPTLLVLTAALGWFETWFGAGAADEAEQWIVDRAVDVFGADSEVPEVLSDLFASPSPGALTFGLVVAVYTASRGFAAVVRAIDVAYDEPELRDWLAARLVGLGLAVGTVLVGALTVLLLVVGPFIGTGAEVADSLGGGDAVRAAWDWLRWPLATAVLVAWAMTLYHVAPAHRSPWRWELPGAVTATVSWLVATWGFGTWLDLMGQGTNAVLGVLGGAISLLLWLYVLAMGLLAGAEVNGILARWYGVSRPRRVVTPMRDLWRWARRRVDARRTPTDPPPVA